MGSSDVDDAKKMKVEEIDICFMDIESEVHSNENCSYDKLCTSYDEIFEEFEKISPNYSILKKKRKSLLEKEVKKLLETQKDFEKEKVNYDPLIKKNLFIRNFFTFDSNYS